MKEVVRETLGVNNGLNIKHMQDFRNYKVNIKKASIVLSFNARYNIKDMENADYYNIQTFKKFDSDLGIAVMRKSL